MVKITVEKEGMNSVAWPSVCLDRFAFGLPDTVGQEPQPWAVCEACGQDIYPGDDYLDVDGTFCCDDYDCLKQITGARLKEAGVI